MSPPPCVRSRAPLPALDVERIGLHVQPGGDGLAGAIDGAAPGRLDRRDPRQLDDVDRDAVAGLALADPGMKARLADLGGVVLAGSPSDFGKLVADETEKWAKVIRGAKIKAE